MSMPSDWLPIPLPEIGAGEEPISVSTWLVELGEPVEVGERVVDVLIPGVSFSIASPSAGILRKIEHSSDDSVHVGDTLGWLEPAGTDQEEIGS